jgi:hypothetical protein
MLLLLIYAIIVDSVLPWVAESGIPIVMWGARKWVS